MLKTQKSSELNLKDESAAASIIHQVQLVCSWVWNLISNFTRKLNISRSDFPILSVKLSNYFINFSRLGWFTMKALAEKWTQTDASDENFTSFYTNLFSDRYWTIKTRYDNGSIYSEWTNFFWIFLTFLCLHEQSVLEKLWGKMTTFLV